MHEQKEGWPVFVVSRAIPRGGPSGDVCVWGGGGRGKSVDSEKGVHVHKRREMGDG